MIVKQINKVVSFSTNKREVILSTLFSLLVFISLVCKSIVINQDNSLILSLLYLSSFVIFFASMIIIIINCKVRDLFDKDSILTKIIYGFFVMSYLITSIITSRMGCVLQSIAYILFIPIMFGVRNKKLLEDIFKSLCFAYTHNFYIVFMLSILMFNIETNARYQGIFLNPNTYGILCAYCLVFFSYNCFYKSKLNWIWIGICMATMYITQCRAAIYAYAITFAIIVIYTIFNKVKIKSVVYNLSKIFIGIFICVVLIFNVSPYISELTADIDESGETNIKVEHDFDRVIQSVANGSEFTSGRIDLWKAYIEEISIYPHNDDEKIYINGNEISMSAHNTYIYLAYAFGIICGLSFLIFNICIGFKSIRCILLNKSNIVVLCSFCTIVQYGMYSLVESMYDPISVMGTFVYILCVAVICNTNEDSKIM